MAALRISAVYSALALLAVLALPTAESYGQVPSRGDQGPTFMDRPAVSPYLNLLRQDNAVLSPYHTFVLPRRQAEQQQQRQWGAIRQLQSWSHKTTVNQKTFQRSTGGGGQYQNYMHFYNFGSR